MDAQVIAIKQEQDAFRDIKEALDRIAEAEDDILNDWVIIGERLLYIRGNNKRFDGTFTASCRMHGIVLADDDRSAAMWWAALSGEQREVLCNEFPDRLRPHGLQLGCRENHPEWSKRTKSVASISYRSKNTRAKQPKTAAASDNLASSNDANVVRLTKAQKKQSLEDALREDKQRHLEELRQQRELKQKAEAKRAAEDRRPRLVPRPFDVVMFGVRMWPEPDRLKLGQYDYDQLFFACHLFWVWKKILPKDLSHESRATNLRTHIGPLFQFADRRLEGFCHTEMMNFIQVFQRLADLYLENPEGECKLPHDPVLSNG